MSYFPENTNFRVRNTLVAGRLDYPVLSGTWDPNLVSDNTPGHVQFTNIAVVSAFYTIVDKNVSMDIRFTADVLAAPADVVGYIAISPPIVPLAAGNNAVGALTTLSQVGLFGNLFQNNPSQIIIQVANVAGNINVPGAVLQMLGAYRLQ